MISYKTMQKDINTITDFVLLSHVDYNLYSLVFKYKSNKICHYLTQKKTTNCNYNIIFGKPKSKLRIESPLTPSSNLVDEHDDDDGQCHHQSFARKTKRKEEEEEKHSHQRKPNPICNAAAAVSTFQLS